MRRPLDGMSGPLARLDVSIDRSINSRLIPETLKHACLQVRLFVILDFFQLSILADLKK